MKKIISLVVVAFLSVSLFYFPVSANSYEGYSFSDGKIDYTIINGEAVVVNCWEVTNGCGHPVTGDLVIPETINSFPVTKIAKEAFDHDNLTSLTVPSSIKEIETEAFVGSNIETLNIQCNINRINNYVFKYSEIKNINLPETITEIGEGAFYCSKIENIDIPKNVKIIGSKAFYSSSITSINIPNSVTHIGDEAFSGCNGLTSVNIPNSVTELGNGAFKGCQKLASLNIGNSITIINENTFDYCISLKNVVIPNNVTKIGDKAFSSNFALEELILSDELESIGARAFVSCRSLEAINIPNKISRIEDHTFSDCTSLKTINIGKGVTNLSGNPFTACSSLENITVEEGNPNYYSIDNCIIDKNTKTLILGCKNSKIPNNNTITKIGDSAFECVDLIDVDIPKGITIIGDRAFAQSNTLKSVNIPEGVTKIGTNAFTACPLERIYIPSSVTSIGQYVFVYCDKLTIYGIAGSYAQKYANSNGIKFVAQSHTHSYGNWEQTKSPTCTENGSQKRVCSSCQNIETKTIPALGHDLENTKIIKEATLSETGIKEAICKRCKQTVKEIIPCSYIDNKTGASFETTEGVFEKGTEIKIKEIKEKSNTYKIIQNALKDITTKFIAYDITAVLNNSLIQPNGDIKITLTVPDDFSKNVAIYYVAEDGTNEKLESTLNENGTISANINHFSSYVICDLDVIGNSLNDETAIQSDNNEKSTSKSNIVIFIIVIVAICAIALIITVIILKKKRKNIVEE